MKPGKLLKHPEGGKYQEVFRSRSKIINSKGEKRSALTHIYFSLEPGETSKFHKVESDEIWNLYQGEGLILYLWDDDSEKLEKVQLSAAKREYCHVVPAGKWQAAKAASEKVIVGCTVGPGFEFEDFKLITAYEPAAINILKNYPEIKELIE